MKVITLSLIFVQLLLLSCSQQSDSVIESKRVIPLLNSDQIKDSVIYIYHNGSKRPPTLISLSPFKNSMINNLELVEKYWESTNGVEVETIRTFKFDLGFSQFPKIKTKELEYRESENKTISQGAFFFVVPKNKTPLVLEAKNLSTNSGKKILKWLKTNVVKISLYEKINVWKLEHGIEPSDSIINSFKNDSFKLDEMSHINRHW